MSAVRRRCTSTWSSSATSTPESPPPPAVSLPPRTTVGSHNLQWVTDLIYKCGGIDKRTIEKFEKVRITFLPAAYPRSPGASSERTANLWLIAMRGIFGLVGLCELLRASASPHAAFANRNTITHIQFSHFSYSMLTSLPGSRRAR
jgi:hypothetical protein